jgi:hypothetical protein
VADDLFGERIDGFGEVCDCGTESGLGVVAGPRVAIVNAGAGEVAGVVVLRAVRRRANLTGGLASAWRCAGHGALGV